MKIQNICCSSGRRHFHLRVCSARTRLVRLRRWQVRAEGGDSRPQLPHQVDRHVQELLKHGLNY
jgi:hypothetical protein